MSQPIFDQKQGGYRVFLGNLNSHTKPSEVENECQKYGPLVDCWVARNPPGFAFVLFKKGDDAQAAVQNLDGSVFGGQRIRAEHAKARSVNARNAPKYSSRHRISDRSRSRSRERSKKKTKSSHHRHHSESSSSDREHSKRRRHRRRSTTSSSSDDKKN